MEHGHAVARRLIDVDANWLALTDMKHDAHGDGAPRTRSRLKAATSAPGCSPGAW